ncbi:hypothetical protein CHS0354_024163 [Potamilus streckersoni]|uniref:TonB-dependent receptor n=1 Tax=Potamilus streckersoni TaxID=2493646 RepID=A0AAE0RZS2_9BIVA|nr:hypothetical protein CHS0354_024163 [Potamilus streckersoni]
MNRNIIFAIGLLVVAGYLSLSGRGAYLYAQENVGTTEVEKIDVKGIVKDEAGESLVGASVKVKGTDLGGKTDLDGRFSFSLSPTAELVVTYVGYEDQTVAVNGQAELVIRMKPKAKSLDEVVVIGYGTQKKSDLTGAVNPVSEKDFNIGVMTTPTELLTGKVAGLQMVTSTGEPGAASSIRVRGGTSISASNEPLYVIDGLALDNGSFDVGGDRSGIEVNTLAKNPLSSINPSDIENITVLKDASATAIYGSRGANGVVIITTKKGVKGSVGMANNVSYDGYVGFSMIAKRYDILSPSEWKAKSGSTVADDKLVDYQNEAFRMALTHNHNISLSGGIKDFGYRVSASYLNQQGILRNSYAEKFSARVNLDHSMFDNHLKLIGSFTGSFNKDKGIAQGQQNGYEGGVMTHILRTSPGTPIYNADGTYNFPQDVQYRNPIAMLEQIQDISESFRTFGNAQFEYSIHKFEDLKVKVNLGYDITNGFRNIYYPKANRDFLEGAGRAIRQDNSRITKTLETYLNYNKEFKEINSLLDVIVGYSYQDILTTNSELTVYIPATDALGADNVVGEKQVATNTKEGSRLASFFGRVNFDLLGRFLLTATVRGDGSSRFSSGNRWGIFPSVAVAWKIIDEQFMAESKDVLSDLKLRVSYGITGNQEIGNYKYLPSYSIGALDQQVVYNGTSYIKYSVLDANPNLKWEETSSFNVGVDYGFLGNRFYGGIDFYIKDTKDLLLTITATQPSSASTVVKNVGTMQNIGLEASFNGYLIDIPQMVSWSLGVTFAWNQNKITSLFEGVAADGIQTGAVSGGGATGTYIQRIMVNQPAYVFYGYQESSRNAAGEALGPDGKIYTAGTPKVLGKASPDVIMGITSFLKVYDFDLTFTFRANIGNSVYNNTAAELSNKNNISGNNVTGVAFRDNIVGTSYLSSRWVENASFLKLDNITLGYNYRFDNFRLRIYATVQNVFTITGYSGNDPEVSKSAGANGVASEGMDYMGYPNVVSLWVGCTDLNETPYTKLSPSSVYTSDLGVKNALAGVYGSVVGEAGFGVSWNIWAPQTVSADELVIPVREGKHWDDAGRPRQCHQHDFDKTAVDWRYGEAYGVLSKAIATANDFIANTETTEATIVPNIANYRAQARFIRAYCYWQMIDMYGDVPLVTKLLEAGEFPKLETRANVYNYIVKELDEIIPVLPNAAADRKDAGEVSKLAAQVLLAKVKMNSKVYAGTDPEWSAVETLCTSVIGAGTHSLEANYFDNFDNDNSNSKEIIWAAVGDEAKTKELIRAVIYPNLHYSAATTYSAPTGFWNGPAALPSFVNRYDTSNTATFAPNASGYMLSGTDTIYYNTPVTTYLTDKRVAMFVRGQQYKRIGGSFKLTGDTESGKGLNVKYTKEIGYRTKYDDATKSYTSTVENDAEYNGFGTGPFTGYRVFKFVPRPGLTQANPNNDYPIFRLADVYLMRAEARVGQSNASGAAADVNFIRKRAAGGVDVAFVAANRKTYSTTAASVTLDDIKDERSRELVNEGHRRTDLIRWGDFDKPAATATEAGYSQFRTTAFRTKHSITVNSQNANLYPIPETYRGANPNLKQNTGY